jgi:2-polyprenyl-6-hydroxyphenyl methylase/3-demethylubiquinone-9 3-methyltransferase
LEILRCPDDRAPLHDRGGLVHCEQCGRDFGAEGDVLVVLPEQLAHLNETSEPTATDEPVRWIEDELQWWNPWHEADQLRPLSPHAGLRGRSRERNLLRHLRPRLSPGSLLIEMGAGTSRTIAGLAPPAATGIRYVATDISLPALRGGRTILGPATASVQCDAMAWPFPEGVADVVLILGTLHHLSDWREALDRACRTVRPGGLLALHEVVAKPRVLSRLRREGANDSWMSPHEGDVPRSAVAEVLERHGRVLRWHGEESPLRFALFRYLALRPKRYELLESSPAMTAVFNGVDQLFGRGPGRVFPSLGFHEAMAVWQRDGAVPANAPEGSGAVEAQRG